MKRGFLPLFILEERREVLSSHCGFITQTRKVLSLSMHTEGNNRMLQPRNPDSVLVISFQKCNELNAKVCRDNHYMCWVYIECICLSWIVPLGAFYAVWYVFCRWSCIVLVLCCRCYCKFHSKRGYQCISDICSCTDWVFNLNILKVLLFQCHMSQ